eukprot:CAMPEP_0194317548 /NCGR_PEP_ID=MMETSP0171-20130528/14290_1 /TAXON_ID=218684 /ORGANISM="Corethron pennatum, Strain L29A3" /LENGTH=1191 /DNA_ID=CAMNT_0039074193 /DNA_START=158 /DNA_END=3729 /DNA_ORIENTATION=+
MSTWEEATTPIGFSRSRSFNRKSRKPASKSKTVSIYEDPEVQVLSESPPPEIFGNIQEDRDEFQAFQNNLPEDNDESEIDENPTIDKSYSEKDGKDEENTENNTENESIEGSVIKGTNMTTASPFDAFIRGNSNNTGETMLSSLWGTFTKLPEDNKRIDAETEDDETSFGKNGNADQPYRSDGFTLEGFDSVAKRTIDTVSSFFLMEKAKDSVEIYDKYEEKSFNKYDEDKFDDNYEDDEKSIDNYENKYREKSKKKPPNSAFNSDDDYEDDDSYFLGGNESDDVGRKLGRTSSVSSAENSVKRKKKKKKERNSRKLTSLRQSYEEPPEDFLTNSPVHNSPVRPRRPSRGLSYDLASESLSDYHSDRSMNSLPNETEFPRFESVIPPEPELTLEEKKSRQLATLTVLYANVVRAIREHKWVTVMEFASSNPDLIMFYSPNKRQNIVHILARQKATVPESIMSKIIAMRPKSAAYADDRGCLPLHYAAAFGNKPQIIRILLNAYPDGARTRNIQGNCPLHLAAALGDYGKESFFLLLQAHPQAIKGHNQHFQTPLHLACSKGGQSRQIVQRILTLAKRLGCDMLTNDADGQSPLHLAIKSRAPFDVIESFYICDAQRAFVQRNASDDLPIHTSLSLPDIDPTVVKIILKSAEFTGGVIGGSKLVPIQLAIKRGMQVDIVKLLLLSDFPFQENSIYSGSSDVKFVEHGHSWWHLLCSHSGPYLKVVEEILKEFSQAHVIKLKQLTGPDGSTFLIDSVNDDVKLMFSQLLQFYGRYELVETMDPILSSRADEYLVLDYGSEASYTENSGKEINGSIASEKVLNIFHNASPFYAETKVREWYNLDPAYVVDLIEFHCDENNPSNQKSFYCISYEKEDFSLETYNNRFRSSESTDAWVLKCSKILLKVAFAIQHLHDQGCVHGFIQPKSIAKYGSQWKLKDVGIATHMGRLMGGPFRECAPPEYFRHGNGVKTDESTTTKQSEENDTTKSLPPAPKKTSVRTRRGLGNISSPRRRTTSLMFKRNHAESVSNVSLDQGSQKSQVVNKNYEQVQLDSQEMGQTKEENIGANALSETGNVNKAEDTANARNICVATPAWDIWSYGLLMAHLILGPSGLPGYFTKDSKFNGHKEGVWKVIEYDTRKMAGDNAADLIKELLQPSRERRIQSMDEVIEHAYFSHLPKRTIEKHHEFNQTEER